MILANGVQVEMHYPITDAFKNPPAAGIRQGDPVLEGKGGSDGTNHNVCIAIVMIRGR